MVIGSTYRRNERGTQDREGEQNDAKGMETQKKLFSWETEGVYVLQTWPDDWINDYNNLRDFSIEF